MNVSVLRLSSSGTLFCEVMAVVAGSVLPLRCANYNSAKSNLGLGVIVFCLLVAEIIPFAFSHIRQQFMQLV